MTGISLVIVESPTKARTIGKILGEKFKVISSMGHIIDLPEKKLGVDIEENFKPDFVVIPGKKKLLAELKKEAKEKDNIYIATDPDREGEAIGYNIKEEIFKKKKVKRVVFHEITTAAIKEAFKHARDFDTNMVEAQISRRVLDRIVGYFLSPLLWKKIARGLSAGRVQSVALKIIIDREKEINSFIPQEYWEVEAGLKKQNQAESFIAKLDKIEDKKAEIKNQLEAEKIVADIKGKSFVVSNIEKKEKNRYASPPFITSSLQQEAFNKLRYNANKTMILAQQLYEGIDIGESGTVGLITYMRTDSPRVAPEAITEVRSLIKNKFGKEYLPDEPNIYKVKKHAQEAHEAIRPSLISRDPQSLEQFLSHEQYELYRLIYNRFLASQMTQAKYLVTSIDISIDKYIFRTAGSTLIFNGFKVVYDTEKEEKEKSSLIPILEKDEVLDLAELIPSQHFTNPPPRFSDSSLVKALEEDGIGRPSTYVPIIQTLILRDYIRRIKGYFHPTELGFKVCEMLVEYFPKIIDEKFTAFMEDELDEIEEGKFDRLKVLEEFYKPFKECLDFAQANIKKDIVFTDDICDKCSKPMIIKWGRKGKFLSCSDYPACKNAKSITTKIKCPAAGCGGELIERRSRRGFFYGCSNFPKCTFISKDLPEEGAKSE